MSKKTCEAIAYTIKRLEKGEDPELVIPYDLSGFSVECRTELLMMYLKYGGTKRAPKVRELLNAGR